MSLRLNQKPKFSPPPPTERISDSYEPTPEEWEQTEQNTRTLVTVVALAAAIAVFVLIVTKLS